MLFPDNPKARPALWDALTTQLTQEPMRFLVKDGVGFPDAEAVQLDWNAVDAITARLRQAGECRISQNRGVAVSPHFAGSREDGLIRIKEFIAYPARGGQSDGPAELRNELELAIIDLLFARDAVDRVFVPLSVQPWQMKDADIQHVDGGLLFKKKAAS